MIGTMMFLAAMAVGQGPSVDYPVTRDRDGRSVVAFGDVASTERGRAASLAFALDAKTATATAVIRSPSGTTPRFATVVLTEDVIEVPCRITVTPDRWVATITLTHRQFEAMAFARHVEISVGDVEIPILYRQMPALVALDSASHGD